MKRSTGVTAARVIAFALGLWPALAHGDPRHAVDRFEPSEHGSDWLANESLDLRGRFRPSAGYVVSYSSRSFVVPSDGTSPDRAPVKDLAFLHFGGSVALQDRLRLALALPFQVYAGGDSAVVGGKTVPAPPKEEGLGDLRFGADVRVFGRYRSPMTIALGAQLWAPTGQKSQWTSDGVFRLRPRVMLAGELDLLVWAAQLGAMVRDQSELTGSVAVGVRLAKTVILGPELFASTLIDETFSKRRTPIEAMLGAHWLIDGTARIGGGLGTGLNDAIGAPSWRAIFAIEWAPEMPEDRPKPRAGGRRGHGPRAIEPDGDHDGILDSVDACPQVVGVATNDPQTNGCPPDTDEDGIDDLSDACPTVRGIASPDAMLNGCPDRDRDKDGVPNDVDACPDDRGPPDVEPRRNGCPSAFVHGDRIELLDAIAFKLGGSELVPSTENEATLTAVLSVLLKLPEGRKLRIEGYTDNRGDPAQSRRLSATRASAVAKWLVEHGIDRARISSEGFGPERPIATNETEAGRAENQRLELRLEP